MLCLPIEPKLTTSTRRYKTFTVGPSHFVHLSSPLPNPDRLLELLDLLLEDGKNGTRGAAGL